MQIDKIDSGKSEMQSVKQRFYALRNGVLADVLRKAGSPYRIIFGLNLPQIQEIANAFGFNESLANQLWENKETRESRLLAPMLVNPEFFKIETAKIWLNNLAGSTEELDVLCHKLLRKTPFATELQKELKSSDNDLLRYVSLRLSFSLIAQKGNEILKDAKVEMERNSPLTQNVARQLMEEAIFVLGVENQ